LLCLKKKLKICFKKNIQNYCNINHGLDCRGTFNREVPKFWEIRRSTRLLRCPSGGRWEGDALSKCPAKVGGEWLTEVYGDVWPFLQALIASSSVGSPGRPAVSSDQHRGLLQVGPPKKRHSPGTSLWRRMVSRSAPKSRRRNKRGGGREQQRDRQLVTSTWPSETLQKKKKSYGSLGFTAAN